jgi:hypothetical protein
VSHGVQHPVDGILVIPTKTSSYAAHLRLLLLLLSRCFEPAATPSPTAR